MPSVMPRKVVVVENSAVENSNESMKRTLRSTGLIGGATVAALIFGLIRAKAFALLLGPSGIGLFGILTTLTSSGAAIVGLNLQTSGVRSLSVERAGGEAQAEVHAALWMLTWMCATVGTVFFVLFVCFAYAPTADLPISATTLAVLAGSVFLAIVGGTQLANLQAAGRVGDVARTRFWGGLLAAIGGVAAVAMLRSEGLYLAVLLTPLAAGGVSTYYFLRVARPVWPRKTPAYLKRHWVTLLRVGGGVTLGMLATGLGQLALRAIITRLGGLDATGLFQAAATVSSANLAIVLAALAVDYLPRLSASVGDRNATSTIFNDQLRVALLFAAPALTALCAMAPWVIQLLFSRQFLAAAPLLQWMLVGDVLKIFSWCLGYIVLARGATAVFVIGEVSFQVVSLTLTWVLYPALGVVGVGLGYVLGYLVMLAIYGTFAVRAQVQISTPLVLMTGGVAIATAALAILAQYSPIATLVVGAMITMGLGIASLKLLRDVGVVAAVRGRFGW